MAYKFSNMSDYANSLVVTTYADSMDQVITKEEKIYWKEQPQEKAYVMSSFFSMFPFALIWASFDFIFVFAFLFLAKEIPFYIYFIFIPFILVHMTPVWLWIAGISKAKKGHKNELYVLTNKRVIHQSGVKNLKFDSIYYTDIVDCQIRVTKHSKKYNCGNVYIKLRVANYFLTALEKPLEVIEIIKSLSKGEEPNIIQTHIDLEPQQTEKPIKLRNVSMKDRRDSAVDNIFDEK